MLTLFAAVVGSVLGLTVLAEVMSMVHRFFR